MDNILGKSVVFFFVLASWPGPCFCFYATMLPCYYVIRLIWQSVDLSFWPAYFARKIIYFFFFFIFLSLLFNLTISIWPLLDTPLPLFPSRMSKQFLIIGSRLVDYSANIIQDYPISFSLCFFFFSFFLFFFFFLKTSFQCLLSASHLFTFSPSLCPSYFLFFFVYLIYKYKYIYTHTHIDAYIRTHTHTHIYIYIYAYIFQLLYPLYSQSLKHIFPSLFVTVFAQLNKKTHKTIH